MQPPDELQSERKTLGPAAPVRGMVLAAVLSAVLVGCGDDSSEKRLP